MKPYGSQFLRETYNKARVFFRNTPTATWREFWADNDPGYWDQPKYMRQAMQRFAERAGLPWPLQAQHPTVAEASARYGDAVRFFKTSRDATWREFHERGTDRRLRDYEVTRDCLHVHARNHGKPWPIPHSPEARNA